MKLTLLLTAATALLALTSAPATADREYNPPSRVAATPTAELHDQAVSHGLSPAQAQSLQARVDRVIDRTGGTQVAINQVAWEGGDTLVPLPGETRARELSVVPAASTVHGCEYYQFCTYAFSNFTGMVDRMSSCTWHYTPRWFGAYVNNQTPGTRARFYDYSGRFLSYTRPAFYAGSTSLGDRTNYIRPC
ncbi:MULTISPECIES: hypothetical protein [unclassified Nocardioides]|uniref:hypothetical protein n=1 Tax=unclassified Nocardioides TaxID=2615069 RepID=UPI0036202101